MKKINTISIIISSLTFLALKKEIFAAQQYVLLEPLTPELNQVTTIGGYAQEIFRISIGLAAVLAVLMIAVGGIKYMTAEAFTGKSDAKDTIKNAVYGLLIIIFSWLILFTINPNLIKVSLPNLSGITAPERPTETDTDDYYHYIYRPLSKNYCSGINNPEPEGYRFDEFDKTTRTCSYIEINAQIQVQDHSKDRVINCDYLRAKFNFSTERFPEQKEEGQFCLFYKP
ncbi:pilin [Patescibacteria group bacterium]